MNSPKKAQPAHRNWQSLSVKPLHEFKKTLEKKKVMKKVVGFGSSIPSMPLKREEKKLDSRFGSYKAKIEEPEVATPRNEHLATHDQVIERLMQSRKSNLVQSRSQENSFVMDGEEKKSPKHLSEREVSISVEEDDGPSNNDDSYKEFIKTDIDQQEEEGQEHQEQSMPSVKLTVADKEQSFDTFSHLRGQDTTAGASIKLAANMLSSSNLQHQGKKTKGPLLSANATHHGGKNFQGIDEIPDENSAIVKNERADTSSHGRWSSDIHDETLTMINSCRNEPVTVIGTQPSGFNDQHRV
mmetsp:Transcript_47859/g.63288  ORF Transcript_47859/g.63288 Transcript_47859/m.63288 type:complete len:298 (-) Transcript_47859:53-946(-)